MRRHFCSEHFSKREEARRTRRGQKILSGLHQTVYEPESAKADFRWNGYLGQVALHRFALRAFAQLHDSYRWRRGKRPLLASDKTRSGDLPIPATRRLRSRMDPILARCRGRWTDQASWKIVPGLL